jgi:hypothetical protein
LHTGREEDSTVFKAKDGLEQEIDLAGGGTPEEKKATTTMVIYLSVFIDRHNFVVVDSVNLCNVYTSASDL